MTHALTEAKLKVMEAVPYVKKRSSEQLRYTFAGEADLIQALRPAMIANGISVHCSGKPEITVREYTTQKGAVMVDVTGTTEWEFVHVSGDAETHWVLAQAADSGDKAAGKFMTSSLKYALRQFFLIETGDDPDEVVAERHSVNSEAVSAGMRAIANAKTDAELDDLFQRFLVSEKAGFDDAQIARLERAIASKRGALQAKSAMKKTRE